MKVTCMPIACFVFSYLGEFLAFKFLRGVIGMHISMLVGVENRRFTSWKNGHILQGCSFWSLIPKMKISYMPIAYFISWLFTVNALFFTF